jgi:hypothetical protein
MWKSTEEYMDDSTKRLLHDHNQISLRFSRERIGMPAPCFECSEELKVYWQYCPRCGQPVNR